VIGEGKMGSGIFNFLLEKNIRIVWLCSNDTDTDKIERQMTRRILRLPDSDIQSGFKNNIREKVLVTKNIHCLSDCDLIIEAIPENIEAKKSMFVNLNEIVKPGSILTSNSSSIKPSVYNPSADRAGKIAGLHFFYPVALKNIVEINLGTETSQETVGLLSGFLESINRKYLILNHSNVFLLNKILLDVQNEAWLIVEAGHCSKQGIDHLVRKNLFPFGIFDFCDSVGLDTMLASILNYTADYPHRDYYSSLIRGLEHQVKQGKTGMKNGEGFYFYPHETTVDATPANSAEIVFHLRQTWLSASKRFTAQAHIPIDEANYAIKEYFGIEKGPFE
jgi:3-hydroxybutyryl-CoA dehydrogenase